VDWCGEWMGLLSDWEDQEKATVTVQAGEDGSAQACLWVGRGTFYLPLETSAGALGILSLWAGGPRILPRPQAQQDSETRAVWPLPTWQEGPLPPCPGAEAPSKVPWQWLSQSSGLETLPVIWPGRPLPTHWLSFAIWKMGITEPTSLPPQVVVEPWGQGLPL
jgi:hypothetical protein